METCREITRTWTERVRRVRTVITKVARTVCRWLPWPLSALCSVIVDVVETVIEWFEDVVHTVTEIICTPIDVAIGLAGRLLGAALSIPILGPIVRGLARIGETIVNLVGGLPELVGWQLGVRPIKRAELHLVVLSTTNGPLLAAGEADVALRDTQRIFAERARVEVATSVHVVRKPAPRAVWQVDADGGLLGEELTLAGTYFQQVITSLLGGHIVDRRPAPVFAFVVPQVGTTQTGCSLGPLVDWFVIEPDQLRSVGGRPRSNTLAHELGHACGLAHATDGDVTNLLYPYSDSGRGDNLSGFQVGVVRSSSHVAF